MYLVQIDTMKCFYCPQKGASVVPWYSLSPADQISLWETHPDAGEGAVCELCVRSAQPSTFFLRSAPQSTATSSATQSVSSGLQLPSAPLAESSGAASLATQSAALFGSTYISGTQHITVRWSKETRETLLTLDSEKSKEPVGAEMSLACLRQAMCSTHTTRVPPMSPMYDIQTKG